MAYEPMTAAKLNQHKSGEHGRDYTVSCDGYGDMEQAEKTGWTVLSNWGRDGWDLGTWPFVVISIRERVSCRTCGANLTDGSGDGENGHWANCASPTGRHELQQVVEGDHTLYGFATYEEATAAIDYLFLWYAAGKHWAPLTEADRAKLDLGQLTVDDKWRGPFRG